jgi:hypothetical protein
MSNADDCDGCRRDFAAGEAGSSAAWRRRRLRNDILFNGWRSFQNWQPIRTPARSSFIRMQTFSTSPLTHGTHLGYTISTALFHVKTKAGHNRYPPTNCENVDTSTFSASKSTPLSTRRHFRCCDNRAIIDAPAFSTLRQSCDCRCAGIFDVATIM